MDDRPEVLARADGVLGEVVLRRRAGPVHELIVNGVFLMDTAETSTERLLAATVLAGHATPRRVLVAGLGLGCTLSALLDDPRVRWVDVVEIEPLLVGWLRDGLVPGADAPLADPRVRVLVDDVRHVLRRPPPEPYDGVVLDVDNGPTFLVHDRNAAVYEAATLRRAAAVLRPGGLLVLWSSAPAPALHVALAGAVGPTDHASAGSPGGAVSSTTTSTSPPGHSEVGGSRATAQPWLCRGGHGWPRCGAGTGTAGEPAPGGMLPRCT